MNIISCDNCGTAFDKRKLNFPESVYTPDGSVNGQRAVWDDNSESFLPVLKCPVCETKGLVNRDFKNDQAKQGNFNMNRVHGEIFYDNKEKCQIVHSDICPPNCSPMDMNNKKYKDFLHRCLEEWLENSGGTGYFYIKSEEEKLNGIQQIQLD